MWEDPIIKEVRDARLEIEQECDGDFQKIYERALKIQKSLAERKETSDDAKVRDLDLPLVA